MKIQSIVVLSLFSIQLNVQAAGIYPGIEAPADPQANWLGVVGDSGSTGAASDRNLQPTLGSLGAILLNFFADQGVKDIQPALQGHPLEGLIPQFDPPRRVFYTDAETQNADAKSLENGMKAALRLDLEENSFGYQFGRRKGFAAKDIVFVGQDGARVDSIPKQIARFYARPAQTLPAIVLISYNANDLCDAKLFEQPVGQRAEFFALELKKAWTLAAAFMKPHPLGTQFLVLSPIEVANVLTNPELLDQQIDFESRGGMSCRELRETNFRAQLDEVNSETDFFKQLTSVDKKLRLEAQAKVQETLVGMCAAVLGTKPGDQDRLSYLAQLQAEMRQIWRDQIVSLNQIYGGQKMSFQFVEGVADIRFTKGDVANDCFHPSATAHAKITETLLKEALK